MIAEFQWRHGSRMKGSAQDAGDTLREIEEKDGILTAENVVADARSRGEVSPLFGYFELNDDVAAGRYRSEQARHIIRSVQVVEADSPDGFRPAYCHVIDDGGVAYYGRPEVICKQVDLWAQVLNDVVTGVESWQRRLNQLTAVEASPKQKKHIKRIAKALSSVTQEIKPTIDS